MDQQKIVIQYVTQTHGRREVFCFLQELFVCQARESSLAFDMSHQKRASSAAKKIRRLETANERPELVCKENVSGEVIIQQR